MSRKCFTIIVGLLIGLLSIPALAQENDLHTVTFDGVSFSYDSSFARSVNIWHYPGDPVEGAGAGFSDAANVVINLFDTAPAPESPLDAKAGIRIYKLSDLAQYDFMQAEVDRLQALIDGKADLASYETNLGNESSLPFLPVPLHGQILRTHASLIETPALKGISYLTVSPTVDAVEPLTSSSFIYVFQGISTDGKTYVSASIPLTTTLFQAAPTADAGDVSGNWQAYLIASAKTLDAAESGDFNPSLDTIEQLIQSFSFQAG